MKRMVRSSLRGEIYLTLGGCYVKFFTIRRLWRVSFRAEIGANETWTDDERLVAYTPPGYFFDFVNMSEVKRLLQHDMPSDLRLKFLEYLNDHATGDLTLEAMQRIDPANDEAMKLLEIKKLSINEQYRTMQKRDIKAAFCNLNSSIIEAIKLCPRLAR
jgi:hypothetical protein